jgi:hypothetical protein
VHPLHWVFSLEQGSFSTRHVIHTTEGKVVNGGIKKWMQSDATKVYETYECAYRTTIFALLLEQLGGHDKVQWGHQYWKQKPEGEAVDLSFMNGIQHIRLTLVAEPTVFGLSAQVAGDDISPLRYLDCIVILGVVLCVHLKG